jgi:TRAP-type C4-dicarboxylate transport system substrate-binding protein
MIVRMSVRLMTAGLILLAGALPHAAAAAEFVLRFATINLEDSPAYQQVFKAFADAVAKDSDGRIEVAVKPLGGYGKPADLFNMVERGDIEIASTVQGYNPGRFPQSSVMELPMMFDSAVSGTAAMQTMFKEGRFDKDYASVKPLGMVVLAPYGIFTTGRKMQQVKDLRGLRVRTPSPTAGLALAKLGMIPIGVPVNLIGETIANGTVDAITYGWDSIVHQPGVGGKMLIDQVSVLIDANFAAPAMMVVMNKAAWNALPPDLQAVIAKDSAGMSGQNAKMRDASDAVARDLLKADTRYTYIALTAAQHADIERLVQPVVAQWKQSMAQAGLDGEGLYNRERELVHQSSLAAR